jgi:uncharacterized protein (TIGR03643 family)
MKRLNDLNIDSNYCHYSDLPSVEAYRKIDILNTERVTTDEETDRIIEMAWEDRTPFDAIKMQFGLNEQAVRNLMRKELKASSYNRWRKRVEECKTKHAKKRLDLINRFKSSSQRLITKNKISKR